MAAETWWSKWWWVVALAALAIFGGGAAVVIYRTRGAKIHNPGNIEKTIPQTAWLGIAPEQPDKRFLAFVDDFHGLRAFAKTLLNYWNVHGIRTVYDAIARWAPASDGNDVVGYSNTVAKEMGISPKLYFDLRQRPDLLKAMVVAMAKVEQGGQTYDGELVASAVSSARQGLA